MTVPRLLELIALAEDIRGQRIYEQGIAVNLAQSDKPERLERLLGIRRQPTREELMAEVPLPVDYFEKNGGVRA